MCEVCKQAMGEARINYWESGASMEPDSPMDDHVEQFVERFIREQAQRGAQVCTVGMMAAGLEMDAV